jgi:small-conductance mechanosensitive channel
VNGARRLLQDLIEDGQPGRVGAQRLGEANVILVGSRAVFPLTPADVDDLAGETLDGITTQTIARLQRALDEAAEVRAPRVLLLSIVSAAGVLLLAFLALSGLARAHRIISAKLVRAAEERVTKAGIAPLHALRASRVLDFQRYVLTALFTATDLILVYGAATFALRQFPYTRPWGESMSGFLLTTVSDLGSSVLNGVPGLFVVFLIVVVTRFLVRLIRLWFDAVERGYTRARWIYPDTAQPTRRLVTLLLWLFAVVAAYPYMPGSQTDAFKGVSVFLGLMVTFGSSGLVNQIMSGFVITYSRALRVGDFVKIGDVEGTVLQVGVLSTRVKTLREEEVTVPNAVVVSQTATAYARYGEQQGVFTPASVSIGYDTPWRQVESLLLMAAERTSGLRKEPKPIVLQASLEDFYVKYTLLVCLERQDMRLYVLDDLHAHIQDLFNEYGVQIMSPNYVLDPAAPKVVAKRDWYAAPARPDPVARDPSA